MSERAVLLVDNLEEPENADLSLTDVCRQMLEEAGLIADEGSVVCDCCSDAHYYPGPEKFGCIHCRVVWHNAGYPWLE